MTVSLHPLPGAAPALRPSPAICPRMLAAVAPSLLQLKQQIAQQRAMA